MCPEVPITSDSPLVKVYDWLKTKKAKMEMFVPEKSAVNILSSRTEAEKVLLRATIGGEPFELLGDKKAEERKLSCSYNHAKELKKLGIEFPKSELKK